MSKFSITPVVHAEDEDIVCPMDTLKEKCSQSSHAKPLLEKYNACNARVLSRKQTTENCEEELFDFLHELDHCVSKTLFSKLK